MQAGIPSVTAAIVGAGNIGRTHAGAYAEAGARVAAVCDVDRDRAASLAAELQAAAYTDVDMMLDEVRPTVVSVCTPPAAHTAPACAAARRGIPILCEKPLAESVPAAESILAATRAGGSPCMVGFCHRFHEPVVQIRELLAAGEIGEPVLFRNRFAFHFAGVEKTWFSDPGVSGGGTLMDTSVHSLDLYRFLIGEITQVGAQLQTRTPGLRVEDNSVLLVNGPSGVPGIVEASWTTPVGDSMLVIYGTRGNLTVDYDAGDFGVARIWRAEEVAAAELPRSGWNRFTEEIRHFISAATAGQAPSPGGEDGLRVLKIVEAAYRAARSTGCTTVAG